MSIPLITITILLLAIPSYCHNEDKYANRCISCNQYGMTYCASPPNFDVIGYCADTELHCTNTHILQKNLIECKRADKFAADNGANGL